MNQTEQNMELSSDIAKKLKKEPEYLDFKHNETIDVLNKSLREIPSYWNNKNSFSEESAKAEMKRFVPSDNFNFIENEKEEEHELIFNVNTDSEYKYNDKKDFADEMLKYLY